MSRLPGVRIAPSVLSADLGRLADQVAAVEEGGAAWIHVDVMDGQFVPDITFGSPVIRALRRHTGLPIDVHLMVTAPERYIDEYADLGASVFTFHPEATVHVQRHLDRIRTRGMMAGLALNPSTPLSAVEEVLSDVDLLLVMSVNPGYGGQTFLPGTPDKISRLRAMVRRAGVDPFLEVDGGITAGTIGAAWTAGADTFVSGTAVFGAPDPAGAVRTLYSACSTQV